MTRAPSEDGMRTGTTGRFLVRRRNDEAYWLDQLETAGRGPVHA